MRYRKVGASKILLSDRRNELEYGFCYVRKNQEARSEMSLVIIYNVTTIFQHPGNWRMNSREMPQKKFNFHIFASEQGKIKSKIEEDSLYLTSAFQILSKYI